MKLTDDVKQRKQKHFKQYRTAKQKLTNKENLVRFLHRGKPETSEDIARQSREILQAFVYKRFGNMIDFKALFLAVSVDFANWSM